MPVPACLCRVCGLPPVRIILSAVWFLLRPLRVEVTLTIVSGLVGGLLLTHPLYFDQHPETYGRIMDHSLISAEWHWGLIASIACALKAGGLALTRYTEAGETAYALRMVGLGVSFLFWVAFCGLLASASVLNLASVLTGAMALTSLRGMFAGPGDL